MNKMNIAQTAYNFAELSSQFTERMTAILEGDDYIAGIRTGFFNLDPVLGGFQSGHLYVIGARPAVGKTAFMINLVHNMALNQIQPRKVMVFTANLSAQLLMQRLVSCATGVWLEKIARGRVESHEWKHIQEIVTHNIPKASLIFDENPVLTIEYMREILEAQNENRPEIIFIDDLQLMKVEGARNRDEEMAAIMRGLRKLAKIFSVPIVVFCELSHVSKKNKKEKRMPKLSDLRLSGVMEQEADVVMFLYRPEYYEINPDNVNEQNYGETYISIEKNMLGILSTIRLKAELHIQKFSEYDDRHLGY